jgi:hypothetical protein
MKRMAFTAALLAAAWGLFAQQSVRQQFDLSGGYRYRDGSSTLDFTVEGKALVVSGTASGKAGGGYIIESSDNMEFNGFQKLILRVSGISEYDRYNVKKLLKLELNGTSQRTITQAMRNRGDPDYINAQNEDAVFSLSDMRNIKSINLVFFDCAMNNVRIEVFYE